MLLDPVLAQAPVLSGVLGVVALLALVTFVGGLFMIVKLYQKVDQGTALVRTAWGARRSASRGCWCFPSSIVPNAWTSRSNGSRFIGTARKA